MWNNRICILKKIHTTSKVYLSLKWESIWPICMTLLPRKVTQQKSGTGILNPSPSDSKSDVLLTKI